MKFDSKQFKLDQKKQLAQLEEEAKKKLQEVTGRILAHAVALSPVGESKPGYTGGRLRKSWDITPIRKVQGNGKWSRFQMAVINNTNYAVHVEHGHRTRLGTGKASSKLGGKPYVDGQFFLKTAVKKALKEVKR